MKFKQVHIGSFGGLSDCKLDLAPGLNVIYGENGAGKSTLFSFLKICLYGFGRGEREKFSPWNGTAPHGSFFYEHEGEWLYQGKFGKNSRGDKISLLNHVTGETFPVPESFGRELFSMGEETFTKTACISQGQLEIIKDNKDEIAEKLANLEQTGESGVSYVACQKKLDAMSSELRKKRGGGGLLNEAEQKVLEYLEKERLAREKLAQSAHLYRRIQEIETTLQELKKAEQQWKQYEKTEQKRLCLEYQEKLTHLTRMSEGVDEEYEIYETLAGEWKREEETLRRLQQQQEELSPAKSVLCSQEEFARVMSGGKLRTAFLIGGLLAGVLLSLCGLFLSPWWFIPAGLSVGIGVLLAFVKREKPWEAYGYGTIQEFSQQYTRSLEQQSAYEAAVIQQKKQQEQIEIVQQKMKEYEQKGSCLNCKTPEQLQDLCRQRRAKQAERKSALEQKATYEHLLEQALAGKSIEEVLSTEDVARPRVEKEDVHQQQLALTKELEQATAQQQNLYEVEPAVLTATRIEWEQKRDEYRQKEQVLSVVSEVLESAYQQMEQQFGGTLNQKAGEWLSKMTDGKYSQARISRDYRVTLTEEAEAHSLEQFSGGVFDQTYLAFRLAMLELMGAKVPLFLDDVLMQYDDKRAAKTMDVLEEFSRETGNQILLFTCRNRDVELAQNRKNVNCIEIL